MSAGSQAALWFTVLALGVYHGLNPAMGWPLAVANGMAARRGSAVIATLMPLGAGHLLAMAVVVLPFTLLTELLQHARAVRLVAGGLVLLFGIYLVARRRHPRYLARIRPTQLAWWSFVMATAHGAGLMLLPVSLGLCSTPVATEAGGGAPMQAAALQTLLASNAAIAIGVTLAHTAAMLFSGVAIAWLVYRWLGLRFLRRAWLNLDVLWGLSLVVMGGFSATMALRSGWP